MHTIRRAHAESTLNTLDVRWEIVKRSLTFVSHLLLFDSLSLLVHVCYELVLDSFRFRFWLVLSSHHYYICRVFQRMFAYSKFFIHNITFILHVLLGDNIVENEIQHNQGVQRRMVLVVIYFLFLKTLFLLCC